MKKGHDSILSVVHETAKGLRNADIMDEMTMREFDALCLPPVKTYQPQEIRQIRLRYRVSQAVFATYLNVSKTICGKLGVWREETRSYGCQTA